MRREIKLLRIELERLRAMEKFLFAVIGRIMDSRDQWQREAERLRALMAQVPCSAHEDTLNKPHWLLFWWRDKRHNGRQ
jgi:hypothetical protein